MVAVAEWEWEMGAMADTASSYRLHSHFHQRLPPHPHWASLLQPLLRCFPITLLLFFFFFFFKFFALLDQTRHRSPRHHCPRRTQAFPIPIFSLSSSLFSNNYILFWILGLTSLLRVPFSKVSDRFYCFGLGFKGLSRRRRLIEIEIEIEIEFEWMFDRVEAMDGQTESDTKTGFGARIIG